MRLELKNFKYIESLSDETPCFSANLYVEGKLTATAENHGTGGSTMIYAHAVGIRDVMQAELRLRQAEAYCKTLPPLDLGHDLPPLTMSVEHWVDEEVERLLVERGAKKIVAKFRKKMKAAIMFVVPGDKPEEGARTITLSTLEKGRNYVAIKYGKTPIILNDMTDPELLAWVKEQHK